MSVTQSPNHVIIEINNHVMDTNSSCKIQKEFTKQEEEVEYFSEDRQQRSNIFIKTLLKSLLNVRDKIDDTIIV